MLRRFPITLARATAPPYQSPAGILAVENFPQFQSFPCSKSSKIPEQQVICEAADRLESVEQGHKYQPNLILQSKGLPKPNGIEGRQWLLIRSGDCHETLA